MTRYWCEHAWLPNGLAHRVLVTVTDGRFDAVEPNTEPGDAIRLPGVVLPGFANVHSHAFHRALRGRTHDEGGTFWTWRDRMYHVAARLDPDNYLALARAVYAEMALAGITGVAEFHYVHHRPDGTPYDDPNAMGLALQQAAVEAGVRLTLLDTLYLRGGLTADGHTPLTAEQRRFGDGDADRWAARVRRLADTDGFTVAAAVHSVRAVPRAELARVADVAPGEVVHAHVSEQPAENEACEAFYGVTPVELLAEAGLVSSRFTAVHATHLTAADVRTLGEAGAFAGFCPTTERDLADGIGPAQALGRAGTRVSLGSDQHAVVDMFEEMRAVEMHHRLTTHRRGTFTAADLLAMATRHDSIGRPDAGAITPGARADLVAVRTDTPRTAGGDPAQIVFGAVAADVDTVVRDGETVVSGGRHRLGDVGELLQRAIAPFWKDAT